MDKRLCIGVDYGTDSVRTLLVDTENGEELASSVFEYPRWSKGLYCDIAKNQFRHHPLDYIEGLEYTIKETLKRIPDSAQNVRAISVDTTGSTPVAVNEKGTPLSLLPEFAENPNAMFILWKDHTSIKEAEEINTLCHNWGGTDFTKYSGGIYSSEWFWAKIIHVLREDKKVGKAAFSWLEHCDWIPALLTGKTDPVLIKRSRCAAGHKAMWHTDWGGFPSEEFLEQLDPKLKEVRIRMDDATVTCDIPVGTLSLEWADRLGLNQSVVVGSGAFDAHIGAVGGEIQPYHLIKVIGTSTCDMLIAPVEEMNNRLIHGICGQVDGSIIPGMLGMEAGQSAFGDIYAWYKNVLMWPVENILAGSGSIDQLLIKKLVDEISAKTISKLSDSAAKIPIAESGIIALDWMNGRRTPDANQNLKGAISGLSLGSDAPRIFRALVEATAFGSKAIVDRFIDEGVPIQGVIALGGVAKKSPFIMQILTDTLDMPIKVVLSEQTCALGAAMFAAVVAGIYPDVIEAQKKMGHGFEKTYYPINQNVKKYRSLYKEYSSLGGFIEGRNSEEFI